jgi:hypothetical protein
MAELLELANLQGEFDKVGVKIFTIFTEDLDTHGNGKMQLMVLPRKIKIRLK